MGALATVSPWIPEDDLLLKNAIEAGASLESLAKGAVQFSQKFTVRELQDRWYSLLYDPVVSAEAAFHMIEFERSAPPLSSKFSRTGNSKENKFVSGKRKGESVRSCYYTLRKRIRNEPFNSVDLRFLVAPNSSHYIGNEDESFSGHGVIADPVPNQFGLRKSNVDGVHHAFPEIGDGGTAHDFDTQFHNTVDDDYPVEPDNMHEEVPHTLGEPLSHTKNGSFEEFSEPKQSPLNGDQVHECSMLDENQLSFHNFENSSPLPEMPMWETIEGISEPGIPSDIGLGEKDLHMGDTFSLHCDGDTKNTCHSGYDVFHTDSNLKLEMPGEELQNATCTTECYLAELSNSLFSFSNEEYRCMNDDGKYVIEKSYYEDLSFILNSPNDAGQDNTPNITEQETSVTPDCLQNQSGACLGELVENKVSDPISDIVCDSEVQVPTSVLASNHQFPEPNDEVTFCGLNTEDPEIPCNDDVVFTHHVCPKSVPSVTRRSFQDTGQPSSSSAVELLSNQKTSEGCPELMQRARENRGSSQSSSQTTRSMMKPESGLLHPVGDHEVEFELPCSDSIHRSAGIAYGDSPLIHSATNSMEPLVRAKLIEETTESTLELDASTRIQNHQSSHAKVGSILSQVVNHPLSDSEELPIDNDEDVPYFSDIEAMILDMDLDPEGQDLYSNKEVLRYQHEHTKRAIIRLEQSARSYMQRAIASHGAFAVLYGHHSKHYIKKPEVLLGRATEDVIVDIDLGRDGRANKVSRRQAIIKLDKSGSFHLKNLGKFSISVNDKEIAPERSLSLTSSCLIEIRGMPFIFEMNPACVKRYLDSITQKNQNQEHQV